MSHITIYGYASFNEWVEAGCPGAVSFNPDGTKKGAKRTHLAKCRVLSCPGSMVRDGWCLNHYDLYRHATQPA